MYFLQEEGEDKVGGAVFPFSPLFSVGLCKTPAVKHLLKLWSQHDTDFGNYQYVNLDCTSMKMSPFYGYFK